MIIKAEFVFEKAPNVTYYFESLDELYDKFNSIKETADLIGDSLEIKIVGEWEDDNEEGLKELFKYLCENHDLTYMYSDDTRVYHRGQRSFDHILEIMDKIDPIDAREIWNGVVDKKVKKEYSKQFHWE